MSVSAAELRRHSWFVLAVAPVVMLFACGSSRSKDGASVSLPPPLSRDELLRPETCNACHPQHYQQWASSMHAYAAEDPVFLAMNRRGQRETEGALGDFCVRCHAPMAVREGATTDGLNLSDVPSELKGVTCYFCHNASAYGEPHNGDVTLADDGVMRGPIKRPVDPGVHGVGYSAIHDGAEAGSSGLCGSCHDVVTPAGVSLERTYREYLQTGLTEPTYSFQSCQSCHMASLPFDAPAAAMPGLTLPDRPIHEHLWPAVDVALTPDFPDQEAQRTAVLCEFVNAFNIKELFANPVGNEFSVTLETTAGHAMPSGAAQDRRMWLEAIGYDDSGKVIFESGSIGDQEVEQVAADSPDFDPFLVMLRDHVYDAQGEEVHMFWEAAPSERYPNGYTSNVLAPVTPTLAPHTRTFGYRLPFPVARFTVRLRVRPVGVDIMRSLVESGDLDESVIARMPTFTLLEAIWARESSERLIQFKRTQDTLRCPQDYLCLLEPKSAYCEHR